jgi:hypothetical protein
MGRHTGATDWSALRGEMRASLRGYWEQRQPYQTFLFAAGLLLFLSGLVHLAILIIDGGTWFGPLSWRKPAVFGFSVGVTDIAAAWVLAYLPKRRIGGWLLAGSFAVLSVAEVFLISMQKWRGVASHFNNSTSFDSTVFSLMGVFVTLMAADIVILTLWSFRSLRAPRSMAWAIRLGLVLLVAGQGLGAAIIANGTSLQAQGQQTALNVLGPHGAMKVPHAVTLHALQVLPLLAWILLFTSWDERKRLRTELIGVLGYTALVGATAVQTFMGLAPLDLTVLAGLLVALSAVSLVWAFGQAYRGLRSRVPQLETVDRDT